MILRGRVLLGFLTLVFVQQGSYANKNEDNDTCGLYLALSSTSTAESTTWGVYSGKDLTAGSMIGYPEIGVSLLNLKRHTSISESDLKDDETANQQRQDFLSTIVGLLESLVWVPGPSGAIQELETGKIISSIPGIGALGAFNPKLTNCDWDVRAVYARKPQNEIPEVNHPGRGAYSPFYDITVKSLSDIKAGTEIFMDYGSSWEREEAEDDLDTDDFDRLDETVRKMIEFFEKHEESLDEEAKMQVFHFLTKDVMKAAVGDGKAKKIAALLPPSPDYLNKVVDVGGTLYYSEPNSVRSMEWLESHGLCMDNIRPGPSTIPNAGRGAFATRKIKKEGLVSPVPLIHASDRAIFDMQDLQPTAEGEFMRVSDEIVGQQLLLNYAFGHPESTMVFIPTGAVSSFINHSDEPNAKLVWSKHPGHQKVWFRMDPADLVGEEFLYLGLVMEVVAIRDIEPDEEVFIDYQKEWKEAWDAHVQTWKDDLKNGSVASTRPVDATDLNLKYEKIPFETSEELLEVGDYPKNVVLMAFLRHVEDEEGGTLENPWVYLADGKEYAPDNLSLVSVVSREDVEAAPGVMPYSYTIVVKGSDGDYQYVQSVPHEAFIFSNIPESSDQFVPKPFRHHIGIPDDIFPKGPWRNKA